MSDAMSCLRRVKEGACDICTEEKVNLCAPEEGMQPLVSIHVTCCVRGCDL